MNPLFRVWGLRRGLLELQNLWCRVRYGRRLGPQVQLFGLPLLQVPNWANVRFGRRLCLISDAYFSEPGISHPVIIRLLNPEAKLTIGDDVGISGGGICVQTEVRIGNGVMLGANAFITDTDFHPLLSENRRYSYDHVGTRPVVIEDNVFIGMNSIILKGVRIGRNAVIGAGSVVSRDVPANEIWAGNPARFVKALPMGQAAPRPAPVAAA
ncbi:acyltransferase [Hymenobacter sp. CRA2]|uniref:acyltransferase n=1 Tax=Hymenobacter sp. CRA2 TaxID=1955620 RepID=UPI00098E96E9|nr:acyltransferase [Hymenobacter sp. CRA2]OON65688.1 hypothetical protein B0919_23730 [Hymenobacter sp. CRA2]